MVSADAPLRLSYSSIQTWEQCRFRWYLTHRQKELRPAPGLPSIIGRAAHAAIAFDIRVAQKFRPPKRAVLPRRPVALERLNAVAWRVLNQEWRRADPDGLISGQQRWWALRRVCGAVEVYQRRIAPHMYPVQGERVITAPHPSDPNILFTGVLDCVTERPAPEAVTQMAEADVIGGGMASFWRPWHPTEHAQESHAEGRVWNLVDWKVSKPWDRGKEHQTDQAAAYLWLWHLLRYAQQQQGQPMPPNLSRVFFTILPEQPGADGLADDQAPIPADLDVRETKREVQQVVAFAQKVQDTAAEIRAAEDSDEWPASPGYLCRWCDYAAHCPIGREYVEDKGLVMLVPGLRPQDKRVKQEVVV